MIIEQATIQHLSILAPVFTDYRAHFNQEPDQEKSLNFLLERLETNQAVIFMAIDETDGACMGFTLLYPMFSSLKANRTWTLNDMFIAENYRKFGIATRLLETVKNFGATTSAEWITLKTGTENVKAQALYEKFGFEKDENHYYYYLKTAK